MLCIPWVASTVSGLLSLAGGRQSSASKGTVDRLAQLRELLLEEFAAARIVGSVIVGGSSYVISIIFSRTA